MVGNTGRHARGISGRYVASQHDIAGDIRFWQLEYKTRWYGGELAVIDRWFPSSQTCSACGARAKLTLSDRVYRCAVCGLVMDRDVNAAINIAAQAAVATGVGET